jgi:hypothetical protein
MLRRSAFQYLFPSLLYWSIKRLKVDLRTESFLEELEGEGLATDEVSWVRACELDFLD